MPAITSAIAFDDALNAFVKQRATDMSGTGAGPYVLGADNEPERATFGSFIFGLAPTGTMTDMFVLQGAVGKIIRVKSIIISGTATAATNLQIVLFRRTTAPTGGTPTAITRTAKDSLDGTANMVLNHYAAGTAPTAGTGTMFDGGRLNFAPAANGSIDRLIFQYSWQNDKAFVLRGAAEWLCVNLQSATAPAGFGIDFSCLWTEE
jgi:hypothetical protein